MMSSISKAGSKKIMVFFLITCLVYASIAASSKAEVISINGKVTVEGSGVPSQAFPFLLTQIGPTSNPITLTASASTEEESFSFPVSGLSDGQYYFKISEDTSNVPVGWTYDGAAYIVRVIVKDGQMSVLYPNGTTDESVSTETSQSITIPQEEVPNLLSGTTHKEVEGLACFDHANHSKAPIWYRSIENNNGEAAIGAAYCIDYLVTNIDGTYVPSFDYNDFVTHFTNDTSDEYSHPHGDGKYKEVLWLARNGFMSTIPGNNNGTPGDGLDDFFGTDDDNNLSKIRNLTGITDLTVAEAYSATQLAIWHFTNGIQWVDGAGMADEPDEREIIMKKVYDACDALILKAKNAAEENEVINEASVSVNFDLTGASYTNDGFYGPVKIVVDLLPENMTSAGQIPVTLTPATGMTLYGADKTTPLTGGHSGDTFFVQTGSPPSSGVKLADAKVENATLEDVLDLYVLKHEGGWDAGQAVIGVGKAERKVSAKASLYVSNATLGGIVFKNSYLTSSTPAPSATPSPTRPASELPQMGDDFTLRFHIVLLSSIAVSLLGVLFVALRKKKENEEQ